MKILIVLFLVLPMVAQVPNPGVPIQGRIGPQGNFPLLNGGTIVMQADQDYILAYPDFTGSVLSITTAAGVLLSQTRNIIHNLPANPAQRFGFEFTVQNATQGNQSIVFKGSTGTGVTIPNGQTAMVMFDGTNYVAAGGGGGGPYQYIVPQNYATIQQAIDAAAAANSGPVIIAPGVPAQSFTNPTNVRIRDYRNADTFLDSGFTHDAKEWGVKGDGTLRSCAVDAARSTNLVCGPSVYGTPNFTAADIGKDIIIYRAGPPTGKICIDTLECPGPVVTVVSGGSSGTDGIQPITFTDDTDQCSTDGNGNPNYTTMPYAWVQVTGGVPTGNVIFTRAWRGDKCVHPPTKGTVDTVNGEVTFTGGTIENGDWVTTIAGVPNSTTLTLAEAPPRAGNNAFGTEILYGTDDHDAFERACNAISFGMRPFATGHLTFSGIVMTSHGINCQNPSLFIEGVGYGGLGRGYNSIIQYAGRTKGDYILQLKSGWAAKLARMGFRGNSIAQPDAIRAKYLDTDPGAGISQFYVFDQLSIGFAAVDIPPHAGYGLSHCIFMDNNGNTDFGDVDHTYCQGAEIAFDTTNNQSTNWRFGKIHSQDNNVGFVVFATIFADDYFTENNRVDIMIGSPNQPGGHAKRLHMHTFGGESSAQAIAVSPINTGNSVNSIDIEDTQALGLSHPESMMNPRKIWIDLSNMPNGNFYWRGGIKLPRSDATVILRNSCSNTGLNYDLEGVDPGQIRFWQENDPNSYACNNLATGWLRLRNNRDGVRQTRLDVQLGSQTGIRRDQLYTALQNDNFFQNTTGSLLVRSPRPPGQSDWVQGPIQYLQVNAVGSGSTTYTYQVSCNDGQGLETNPSATRTATNGALNTTTNYNKITFRPHSGCIRYNLYGDSGSGAIGFLATALADDMARDVSWVWPNLTFWDYGIWDKDTGRTPLVKSLSGVVDSEGGYKVNGQPLSTRNGLADFAAIAPQDGQVPVFNATTGKYTPGAGGAGPGGGIQSLNENSNAHQVIAPGAGIGISPNTNGTITVTNEIVPPQTKGVLINIPGPGSNTVQVGHPAIGPSQAALGPDAFVLIGFTAPSAGTVVDCNLYAGSVATGKAYCWLFASGVNNFPQTLLCNDTTGTTLTANSWNKLTGLQSANCPALIAGAVYYIGIMMDTAANMMYDNTQTFQYMWVANVDQTGHCCTAPAIINSASVVGTSLARTAYMTLNVGGGAAAYTLDTTLGTGYLHYDGTQFSWDAGGGGGGGPTALSALTDAAANHTLNNASFAQVWNWALTGASTATGLKISESAASTNTGANSALLAANTLAGSTVSPFQSLAGANGLKIATNGDITAVGTAKMVGPVQLPALTNQSSLGTDPQGNIISGSGGPSGGSNVLTTPAYSAVFPSVSMLGTASANLLSGLSGCINSAGSCLALTPPGDGTYLVKWWITQITPGSPTSGGTGACNAGALGFRFGFTNPDNGVVFAAQLAGMALNAIGMSSTLNFAGAVNSASNDYAGMPREFRAQGGQPITYAAFQSPVSNCDTPPRFLFKIALFGPLGY